MFGASALASAAGPSGKLWTAGYNLCKPISLKALQKAGGQSYAAGKFDGHVCNWERSDFKAGITLSAHPSSQASFFAIALANNGKNGVKVESVTVPGASKAIIESIQPAAGQTSRELYAAFKPGIIQISMTAPGTGTLSDATMLAVMKLVTST